MKLDRRYQWHQAINAGAKGLFGSVITLFCLYRGMDLYQIGLFFAIYYLAIICVDLPAGVLADRYGRLKIFRIAKVLQCSYFVLLMFFDSIIGMILASFIGGIGRAMSTGALEAWYYERLMCEDRLDDIGKLLSKTHSWTTLSTAISAVVGAGFVHFYGYVYLPEHPFLPALLLTFSIHFIALVSLGYFYREGETLPHVASSALNNTDPKMSGLNIMKHTFAKCWHHPLLRAVLLLQLTFGILVIGLQSYWQPVLLGFLVSEQSVVLMGVVAMVFSLFAALASNLIALLLNKTHYQSDRLIIPLFVISCAILMLLALVDSTFGFLVLYVAFGFFMLAVKPLLGTIVHQHGGDQNRAATLSLLSFTFNFAGLLVGLLFSLIAEYFSIEVLWLIIGALGLLVSLSLKNKIALAHNTSIV
jgi:MFS family permease